MIKTCKIPLLFQKTRPKPPMLDITFHTIFIHPAHGVKLFAFSDPGRIYIKGYNHDYYSIWFNFSAAFFISEKKAVVIKLKTHYSCIIS
jgi:hypothetical protein